MAVAPAIFFSGLMSVFRGYFQGHQTMVPTAVSQVIEQLFRVSAVLILAFLLFPRGLEYSAAGATFGAVVGGIVGLIVLGIYYLSFRSKNRSQDKYLKYSGATSMELAREMITLAIPVSFGAVVLPLVQMLDAVIVPGRLMAINYTTSQATALYGQLSGMAGVLIGLPSIFTIAIATSLVPAVSEAVAMRDKMLLNTRINNSFRAGMLISFPCAAGLFILAYPICNLLYATPEAGIPLEILAFSCIMLAAFQLSSASLQGIGHPEIAMRNLIITGIIKVGLNYVLTSVPILNVRGAALATVTAFLIGSFLNIIYLKKLTGVVYEGRRMVKIGLVTVIMTLGVKFVYQGLIGVDIHSHIATLLAIIVGTGIYGVLLLLLKELDWDMVKRIMGK
jgi:stage V sporulation protein B